MRIRIISLILSILYMTEIVSASFPDIQNSFYRDSIQKLADEWIISGFENGTFWPENTISRAEILKIFFLSQWVQWDIKSSDTRCFKDVNITKWYHSYICEWVRLKIVKWFDDGTFGPDKSVTVLEALAIGFRLYGITPPITTPWYTGYREFAKTNNILDSASYSLSTPLSRGKASELILRIREYNTNKNPLQYLSRGCSKPGNLSWTNTIPVNGKDRSYILSIPPGYTSNKSVWLIVAIHGRTNSNTMVRGYMGLEWGRWGSQSDFIVAYPAGIDTGRGTRSWTEEENVTFFDMIVRDIWDNYCIDRSQIYVVAHSFGAWFASKLACMRWDIIRGMGIVGGGGWTSSCNQTPTASLIYQNANDHLSSPLTARATEQMMRNMNTCGSKTESIKIGSLTCQKWQDCSTGNPVIWCEWYSSYGNDPHSWPTNGGTDILNFLRGLK